MVTQLDISIFRCTNTGDNESNLSSDEIVELPIGLKDTDAAGVIQFHGDVAPRRTDVPAPLNQSTAVPDTGLTPPTLTIGIKFNENVGETLNNMEGRLLLWGLQDKTVRGVFPFGRFGIRNNKKPWFNFTPNAQAGWKIVDVDMDDIIQWNGMVDMVVTLQFGGQTSLLAAAIAALIGD